MGAGKDGGEYFISVVMEFEEDGNRGRFCASGVFGDIRGAYGMKCLSCGNDLVEGYPVRICRCGFAWTSEIPRGVRGKVVPMEWTKHGIAKFNAVPLGCLAIFNWEPE